MYPVRVILCMYKNLVDVAFLANNLNKYIFLIMDEMHIKNDLVYDKHEASLIGFVNLGKTNNQLLEFEEALLSEKTELPLASSLLVLMVRGLFCKLNYPYAQFACNDISGALMFDSFWEAISRLERLGFFIFLVLPVMEHLLIGIYGNCTVGLVSRKN